MPTLSIDAFSVMSPELLKQERLKQIKGSKLFGFQSPFDYKGPLGEAGITGAVVAAEYMPVNHSKPDGLGTWLAELPHHQKQFPSVKNEWVEEPGFVDLVAIKVAHSSDQARWQLAEERKALLITNGLFTPEDNNRPIRLLGNGMTKIESDLHESPYLVLEHVPERFKNLSNLLQDNNGQLSEIQALRLAKSLCEILEKLHENKLIHNDIQATKPENIFFDPQTGDVRLIDFGNVINTTNELYKDESVTSHYDRAGLAELLFRMTTGQKMTNRAEIFGKPTKKLSFLTMFIMHNCLEAGYGHGLEGTKAMHQDIKTALEPLEEAASQSTPSQAPEKQPLVNVGTSVMMLHNGKIDDSGWQVQEITPAGIAVAVKKEQDGTVLRQEIPVAQLEKLQEVGVNILMQQFLIEDTQTVPQLFAQIRDSKGVLLPDGSRTDAETVISAIQSIFNTHSGLDTLPQISGLREKVKDLLAVV